MCRQSKITFLGRLIHGCGVKNKRGKNGKTKGVGKRARCAV